MFKKFISMLLVCTLVFILTSCGKKEEYQESEPSTTENTTEYYNNDNSENDATEGTTQIPTVKVTIPEGYTLVRISWLLEEKGFCTSNEFVEAAQSYKEWLDLTQYPFLYDLQNEENVCFYLEGYIFPLTYDIPENATAQEIIKMFLNGSKQVFNEQFMASVRNSGYNLHEILTIASIIEKEAKLDDQRPMISSVIHNRIDVGMRIQCDPTVKYCEGVIKLIYPDKYNDFVPHYSTYASKGLMAGPICNPGIESINAAINPAQTDYLYFLIGTVPPYESKYSETFEEHNKYWQANKDRLTGK